MAIQVEPFSDNWAYLRAELAWLDRLLSLAIARQRKETKTVDRVSRNRADQVSSHWWKGLIAIDGEIASDSPADLPRKLNNVVKQSFQQQMDAKTQVTQTHGVCLSLPMLATRLNLSVFEKSLVVITLAPEISRRYSRIYTFLQETEPPTGSGLPTVDLVLRLLCRNDMEWRSAHRHFDPDAALFRYGLLELQSPTPTVLLNRELKLSDVCVRYLLSDRPEAADLDHLLGPAPLLLSAPSEPASLTRSILHPPTWLLPVSPPQSFPESQRAFQWLKETRMTRSLWPQLLLPMGVLTELKHRVDRYHLIDRVDGVWGFTGCPGLITLFAGVAGTGKTMAATAIAQTLDTSLVQIDLAQVEPIHHWEVIQEIMVTSPMVVLIKSAQHWFGRSSSLSSAQISQFLEWQRSHRGIILLSVQQLSSVKIQWRRTIPVLEFPVPDSSSRLQLWQQAFPLTAAMEADIDWKQLADRYAVTGGEIQAIARDAAFYAAAESSETAIGLRHIVRALEVRGVRRKS